MLDLMSQSWTLLWKIICSGKKKDILQRKSWQQSGISLNASISVFSLWSTNRLEEDGEQVQLGYTLFLMGPEHSPSPPTFEITSEFDCAVTLTYLISKTHTILHICKLLGVQTEVTWFTPKLIFEIEFFLKHNINFTNHTVKSGP